MQESDIKYLKFRYLLWLYKTTKDEFDRIERKFTQLEVDREMFQYMSKHMDASEVSDKGKLDTCLKEFEEYINKKEKDGRNLKFDGKKLRPEYYFLMVKLEAIEKVIASQLGTVARDSIKTLYEQEMRERILKISEVKT